MRNLRYACQRANLHPALRAVFARKKTSQEAQLFLERTSPFYRLKFVAFILLSVLGRKHYDIMGMLGYETFLFEPAFAQQLLGKRRKKHVSLLDIGAGNGSITSTFEGIVSSVSCLEPSLSFQRKLRKRGYAICDGKGTEKYDFITILNVLDICEHPDAIIEHALEHLLPNGRLIISLPFPIQARSWDMARISDTNRLTQSPALSFEESVSCFYTDFLEKEGLETVYFTRLPYLVALPENRETSLYDNGLFVCRIRD